MTTMLQLLIILLLLILTWQDHQYLAVSWLLFPALILMFVAYSLLFLPIQQLLRNLSMTAVFILVQLLVLTLYFSIREKKLVNITGRYLGTGDILFLFALCFVLSPINFIVFYMFSLIATLLRELVFIPMMRIRTRKVPLAGIQAFLLCVVFFLQISCNCFFTGTDAPLLSIFNR
jgi:hypothetical protein